MSRDRARPSGSLPLASIALALLGAVAGAWLLAGGRVDAELPLAGPFGPLRVLAEPSSGPFVLLASVVGGAAAFALRGEEATPRARLLLFTFLVGTLAVPFAGDAFGLLVAWELMSVSPGLLLVLDLDPERRRAGLVYLAYASVSALLVALGLFVGDPGKLGPLPATGGAILLVGAAMKAGLMPTHVWLPRAHAAAPSPFSALMSGVMVAMPAYLVIRFVVPAGLPPAIAVLVLLAGAASAALGSLHALPERNLKRVLAMTTVAHIGVAFALLGLALLLEGAAREYAVGACVAYLVTHGLAKGACFLVAGEIHHATGELDLESLGGLWRAMGALGALGLVAGLSLAGLPPLGGFTSEVAALSAVAASVAALPATLGIVVLGSLLLLGVGAAAGAAAVAKVVLGAFQGPVRTPPTHATPRLAPIAILVAALALVGAFPGVLWGAADPLVLPLPSGVLAPLPILLIAVVVLGLLAFATRRVRDPTRVAPWACGGPAPSMRSAYTPAGLVMPYRILFAEVVRPSSGLSLQEAPVAPFAPARGHYKDPEREFIEPWVHRPLRSMLLPFIERVRALHRGSVHAYLVAGVATLLLALFLVEVLP